MPVELFGTALVRVDSVHVGPSVDKVVRERKTMKFARAMGPSNHIIPMALFRAIADTGLIGRSLQNPIGGGRRNFKRNKTTPLGRKARAMEQHI